MAPCLRFNCVQSLFDGGRAGIDGGDAGFGLRDSIVGRLGSPCRGVVVAEAGVHGVAAGLPHGGPWLTPQFVFDFADGVAVGLPGGAGGAECRMEVGEFDGGIGATAGSVVEVVDDLLTVQVFRSNGS